MVVATRSALLQRDGDVVDMDGISPVYFEGVANGNYYVAIKHRNHLNVMSLQPLVLDSGNSVIDFSNPNFLTYGTGGQKEINGMKALWAGDATEDNSIDSADRSATWNGRNQLGYLVTDVNLDGFCDSGDRSVTWNNRNTAGQMP